MYNYKYYLKNTFTFRGARCSYSKTWCHPIHFVSNGLVFSSIKIKMGLFDSFFGCTLEFFFYDISFATPWLRRKNKNHVSVHYTSRYYKGGYVSRRPGHSPCIPTSPYKDKRSQVVVDEFNLLIEKTLLSCLKTIIKYSNPNTIGVLSLLTSL